MNSLLRCECGRTYRPRAEDAGRAIKCRCGRIVPIPGAPPRRWSWRSPRLRRCFGMLAGAWLLVVLALLLVLWGFGDRWWLATLLLYGPRWPILVPGLMLLGASLAIDRRLIPVLGLGVLLSLGPLMGGRSGWRVLLGRPEGIPLRVVTFNMRGAANPDWRDAPLRLLGLHPDLVLVQECAAGFETMAPNPDGWTVLRHANLCLMSSLPVDSTRMIEVVRTREDGMSGLAVVYFLRVEGQAVTVANVHLETPRHGIERVRWGGEVTGLSRNILVREAGSSRTANWVRAQSPDILVAGDFNLPVESRIYRRHWGRCSNAFDHRGRGFGFTRILPKWAVRIDHVLACGRTWAAVAATPGPDLGSDHLPLVTDMVVRRLPRAS